MIAKHIYEGMTAHELGLSDIQYSSRKETVDRFLESWNGVNFEESFLKFIQEEQKEFKNTFDYKGNVVGQASTEIEKDLTYGEMFSDLAINIKAIAKSGIKLVSVDEHEKRYGTCLKCEYLTKVKRCKKCGCFMKLKSKFASMDCPEKKWG